MRQKSQFDRDALHFAPFVLLPSPFPKDEYYKAVKLQTVLNELMHKVRLRRGWESEGEGGSTLYYCCRWLMTTSSSGRL